MGRSPAASDNSQSEKLDTSSLAPKTGNGVVDDAVGLASDETSDALDVEDFFSFHVLTTCSGKFENKDVVTDVSCSSPKFFNSPLDLIDELQSSLPSGIDLEDIGVPTDDIESAQLGFKIFWSLWPVNLVLLFLCLFATAYCLRWSTVRALFSALLCCIVSFAPPSPLCRPHFQNLRFLFINSSLAPSHQTYPMPR